MYAADMPADQISQALAVCAAANYLLFDGTKQGLGLALLCALACPASEVRRGVGARCWGLVPALASLLLTGRLAMRPRACRCCRRKASPSA